MNKEPVLVVMAAGMGSRYGGGGIKQIDPVGPDGEAMFDYSLFDARLAGFQKVVFIIREEMEETFRKMTENGAAKYMEVQFVYQRGDDLPEGFSFPQGREKPWGTAHAVLSCRKVLDGPFAVVNADDYYGIQAYSQMYRFLKETPVRQNGKQQLAMVGYRLGNTLTENGSVSRGICQIDENGRLLGLQERKRIEKHGDLAQYSVDEGATWVTVPADTTVSMNLWGFSEEFLPALEKQFPAFLEKAMAENPLKMEYHLPVAVDQLIQDGEAEVTVFTSPDRWYGVTHAADKPMVQQALGELHRQGIYPTPMWDGAESCKIRRISLQFRMKGQFVSGQPYGNGHINDTFAVFCKDESGTVRYIVQRINTSIFQNPDQLMANISAVTEYLRKQVIANGGDPDRECLTIVPTKKGETFYRDPVGNSWRCYLFVEKAASHEAAGGPDLFYRSARAFGRFIGQLADYPADTLYETIPNFHHTPKRYEALLEAADSDVKNRKQQVEKELNFALDRQEDAKMLVNLLEKGELPLRVTHNDTKLNNVLLDDVTGEGICVIDLDTVMPGLALYDYGDSIRFGASSGAEDEQDLSKIYVVEELFTAYTRGFLETAGRSLTDKEIDMLPWGAKLMTLECGVRFLTDYLNGDTYFKIHREGHNLDRCRTQFKLVADMEAKWDTLNKIVADLKQEILGR